MASVSEILKTAREFERRGDWESAASEYRKLQQLDPCPPIAYNLMGDLYHRKGDAEEAYRWYLEAVNRYAQEGLYGNAIGVCRKILRQYPEREEITEQLGGLFFSQGLAREAVKHYMTFAGRAAEAGDSEAVVRTAARVREILADDASVRERLGEIFVRLSLPEEGVRDLHAALESYRRSGRMADADRVASRLGEVEPMAEADPLSLLDEKSPSLGLTTANDPVRPAPPEGLETLEELDHSRIEPMVATRESDEESDGSAETTEDARDTEDRDDSSGGTGESETPYSPDGFQADEIEVLDPTTFEPMIPGGASKERGGGFTGASSAERAESRCEEEPVAAAPRAPDQDFVPVEEILREFQDGVDRIIEKDDYQSHYDMGMSYKEMGLFDEALHEFDQASASPTLATSCVEMRGAILLDLGRAEECVDALKDLAEQGDDDHIGIHFLLGSAYEKMKMKEEALREFRFVEEHHPSFRNVRERIDRIMK